MISNTLREPEATLSPLSLSVASAWPASSVRPSAPGESATGPNALTSRQWDVGPGVQGPTSEGCEWLDYLIALVPVQPKTTRGQVILCHIGHRGGNRQGAYSLSLNGCQAPDTCRCLGVTVHRPCLQRTPGLVGDGSKQGLIWHVDPAFHFVGSPNHGLFYHSLQDILNQRRAG